MTNINWIEYEKKNHAIAWFICEAIGSKGSQFFKEFDSENLPVEFKVNGVDLSCEFVKTLDELQRQLDEKEEKLQELRSENWQANNFRSELKEFLEYEKED